MRTHLNAGLSPRAGGRGFSPATMSLRPLKEKELPCCTILLMLVAYTRQLKIMMLATALWLDQLEMEAICTICTCSGSKILMNGQIKIHDSVCEGCQENEGLGSIFFLKNAVLGLGLGLTLALTLTLTLILNNPNHKTAFSKKNRPRPRPRVLLTPVCEENCGRGQAQSLWRFFFLPKSALFCDKISDVVIFGRPLFQWIEGEVDLIEIRYLHAV